MDTSDRINADYEDTEYADQQGTDNPQGHVRYTEM